MAQKFPQGIVSPNVTNSYWNQWELGTSVAEDLKH